MARKSSSRGETEQSRLPVRTIRLTADILIASADTIRRPTKRIGRKFIEIDQKSEKIPRKIHFPQDFD